MYYEVEWAEDESCNFWRVYKARDVGALWKAISYMNMERKEAGRPVMKKIQINVLDEYDGECLIITGNYAEDIQLDVDRSMQ